ncbi:MAG TPA: hypothetical protein VNP20_09365 [Nocardioidaceae bacterium]|nr:hypothetical protein [Nocardioidaceae bacterium]
MRFLADCADCGSVVLTADAIVLTAREAESTEGTFDCPVCQRVCTVTVSNGAQHALVARGAVLVTPIPPAADDDPLTMEHLAELQRLLDDEDACRLLLDGAA